MRRPILRLGFTALSSLLVAGAVACGSGAGADTKSPTSSGAPAGTDAVGAAPEAASTDKESGAAGAASPAESGGTTTTTQLGKGGDLQGAKLGGQVHTETESKGDGGPKSTKGQSANEAGRTVNDLRAIVAARRDEARACYDKGLAAHPGIEGDLDVKWVIDPEGNVSDAFVDTTKSTILEPSVGKCVVDVIKTIKFAASKGGYETRAHYPFNFHPKVYTAKDAGK